MFAPKQYVALLIAAFMVAIAVSCNNGAGDIPFPVKDGGFPQPVSVPLKFSDEKKLSWVTVKTGGIHPAVKKINIDRLPSTPYDTVVYKPFDQTPFKTAFSFDSLPFSSFNFDALPAKPLKFKTALLSPPIRIEAVPTRAKKNAPLAMFEISPLAGVGINRMMQDKNGFIWIASNVGLYRFDGQYLQLYAQKQLQTIMDLVEDIRGRIWYTGQSGMGLIDTKIGTVSFTDEPNPGDYFSKILSDYTGRIWVYASTGYRIKNPDGILSDWLNAHGHVKIIDITAQTYKQLDDKNGLSAGSIADMAEDAQKNIWITIFDKGVNIINADAGRIRYLNKLSNSEFGAAPTAIGAAKNGMVWVACWDEINLVDIKGGAITHYNAYGGLGGWRINDLINNNNANAYLFTNGGLALVSTTKGTIKYISQYEGLKGNYFYSMLLDNRQRLWVATNNGLSVIDQNATIVNPPTELQKSVFALAQDEGGKIWVGTPNGIDIIDEAKNVVRHLKKEQGISSSFIQNLSTYDGNIWVASNGGLDIVNQSSGTVERFGEKQGLANPSIGGTFKDSRDNIWLVGPEDGVVVLDSAKTTLRHTGFKNGLSDSNVVDIKQDGQGRVWLATKNGGVDIIDQKMAMVKYLNDAPGLKDACEKVLLNDNNGRMWIGTKTGIYVADLMHATLTHITTAEGLPNNNVNVLNYYKGSIVAATDNKICIITPPMVYPNALGANKADTEWHINLLADADGLVKHTTGWATDIITKDGRYFWGDYGIKILPNIKKQSDSSATYISGINVMGTAGYFVNKGLFKQHDTIWVGDTFYVKGQNPALVGFKGQTGATWDSVAGPYNMPVNLQIPYNQNYVQFQYCNAHLSPQKGVSYSYVLQGIDRQWSPETDKIVTENYLNLPPGHYTFKVRSKWAGGLWTQPATFSFAITPPWWQTWWAGTLYALVAAFLLWGVVYLRSKKLIKENKALEEKVKQRTAEVEGQKEEITTQRDNLEKTLEELQATQAQLIQSEKMASLGELTAGIAHEIQNPLNFVNNFSEVNKELLIEMREEMDKGNLDDAKAIVEEVIGNEEKINHHGKRADAIVKGMLQHSRKSTGQKELTDINILADEYLRLAYQGLRAKDKSFNATLETVFDSAIGKINIIPQDIGRVLINLFNNAFYATQERQKLEGVGFKPVVSISTKLVSVPVELVPMPHREGGRKGVVTISVADNGTGIPDAIKEKIMQPFFTTKPTGQGTGLGLSLSYDIVKAHGGDMKVESTEVEGTKFIIILPNV